MIAVVASGPSAAKAGVDRLRGRAKVIAINESWRLAPWADILYACDANWWILRGGVKEFKGLKLTFEDKAIKLYPDVRKLHVERYGNLLLFGDRGRVGSGGNGGFQSLNLAAQMMPRKILLVGFDMRIDLGGHWHPPHPPPLSNPTTYSNLPRWIKALDTAADRLRKMGIEVINCSLVSKLTAYRKMTLEEALR